MINLTLKKGNKKIHCKIPSDWSEVTMKQFEDLGYSTLPKQIDPLKAISILAQIPLEHLMVIEGDLKPILAVSKLLETKPDLTQVKGFFVWKDKEYSIEDCQFMPMEKLVDYVQSMTEPYAISRAIAGVIDFKNIDAVAKEVEQSPFMPLLPGVNFFLRLQMNLLISGSLS